jgi:hypothetical protein
MGQLAVQRAHNFIIGSVEVSFRAGLIFTVCTGEAFAHRVDERPESLPANASPQQKPGFRYNERGEKGNVTLWLLKQAIRILIWKGWKWTVSSCKL